MGRSIRLLGRIDPVMPGVRGVLKSTGVQRLLSLQGERAAARCNAMYRSNHIEGQHGFAPHGAPYAHHPKQLGYTAAEVVHVASRAGGLDNARRNTLRKGCGI